MAQDPKTLFKALASSDSHPNIAKPTKDLNELVKDIYEQAHTHRGKLVNFYIWYTVVLSSLVMALIFIQAYTRTIPGSEGIELIPQWGLNLIIVGMFGQFIGLLTLVTKRVWEFDPFFNHARDNGKSIVKKD